jgi:hypothetical protein
LGFGYIYHKCGLVWVCVAGFHIVGGLGEHTLIRGGVVWVWVAGFHMYVYMYSIHINILIYIRTYYIYIYIYIYIINDRLLPFLYVNASNPNPN